MTDLIPLSQVVKAGREEAWRVVYQKYNQPDADMLEIPDLTPFTQYRLVDSTHKLTQQNISSPNTCTATHPYT